MRYIVYTAALFIAVQMVSCKPAGGIDADERARVEALQGLPRTNYARGGVDFSLAEIEGMRATHRDSVPWASYMQETDGNGQLGYYFFPGYARDLASPQVRVEYMAKSLPGCSTVDSLFTWLKSLYVGNERNGNVVGETPVGTLDGQEIRILEIEIPEYAMNDSTRYSEKHMAWGYADNGERFVGFSYSAVGKDDYKQGFPMFKDLIRSYKDDKENK